MTTVVSVAGAVLILVVAVGAVLSRDRLSRPPVTEEELAERFESDDFDDDLMTPEEYLAHRDDIPPWSRRSR